MSHNFEGRFWEQKVSYDLDDKFEFVPNLLKFTTFQSLDIKTNELLRTLMFFSKQMDYRDEREWRVVIHNEHERPLDMNFGDSLKGIIFGYALEKWCVYSCCKYLHSLFTNQGKILPLLCQARPYGIHYIDNENGTLSLLHKNGFAGDVFIDTSEYL